MAPYFIGIDIGTQGARVVVLGADGQIVAQAERVFELTADSREEQDPQLWWQSCQDCLLEITSQGRGQIFLNAIEAIGVTSTSGTVIPLDENHQPLHRAIMYSDKRSADQGAFCSQAAQHAGQAGFTTFNASCGLSKMLWFLESYPEKIKQIHSWIHAADYIVGKLSGCWGITDYTNAFKSGYDVSKLEWPDYLFTSIPLKRGWMPQVLPSGSVLGSIDPLVAAALGLPEGIKVTVGITDGCASQIASGAVAPGNWNTTIGTTMVIKGVTENEVLDPQGRIYSHRHPAGYWMPGGASNTGADWVTKAFGDKLPHYNKVAEGMIPSGVIAYPLRQKGERFPLLAPDAEGFEPEGLSPEAQFTANMEGVAYLERYAYELISHLSGEKVSTVYTAGGASNSKVWVKIRSNVLNIPIIKMKEASGAVGAAISAASKTHFNSLIQAAETLNIKELEVYPEPDLVAQYDKAYQEFLAALVNKRYISTTNIYA